MPGPVSDSYDPEFGTGENARLVREEVEFLRDHIGKGLGDPLPILDVVRGARAGAHVKDFAFSERERRILRFALNRALESL